MLEKTSNQIKKEAGFMKVSKLQTSLAVFLCLIGLNVGSARVTLAESRNPEKNPTGPILGAAPADPKWVGDGYNSVSKESILQFQALDLPNGAVESADGVRSVSNSFSVNSTYELEKEINQKLSASINGGFSIMSAEVSATQEVTARSQFSRGKSYAFAYWLQIEKKVSISGYPILKEEALTALQSNPREFFTKYGNQYVNNVTLGRMFYIVYEADTSSLSSSQKTDVQYAMSLKAGSYAGMSMDSQQTEYVNSTLSNVKITCYAVAVGIPGFVVVKGMEDIDAMRDNLSEGDPAILAKEYKNFSDLPSFPSSSTTSFWLKVVNSIARSADVWRQHYSLCDYIINSTVSSSLKNDCQAFKNDIIINEFTKHYALDLGYIPTEYYKNRWQNLYLRYMNEMDLGNEGWEWLVYEDVYSNSADGLAIKNFNLGSVEADQIFVQYSPKKHPSTRFSLYKIQNGSSTLITRIVTSSDGEGTWRLYSGISESDQYQFKVEPLEDLSDDSILYPVTLGVVYQKPIKDAVWLFIKSYDPKLLPGI